MAEGKDNKPNTGAKDLEEEITCAVCHDHYDDPRVLSCLHYYCKQCIHSLALRRGLYKPFPCPECRKETSLPQGSVDELQAAFFINRMKQVHSKLERATGKVEAVCEMCSGGKSIAFCRQCAQFICQECLKQHGRMKVFAGHKTSTLDELKRGGGARNVVVPKPAVKMCEVHEDPMKFFCFDCNCLICRDCAVDDHSDHQRKSVKKAAPEARKKLVKQLDPLKVTKASIVHAIEEVQSAKSEVEAQGQSVTLHIESSFEDIHRVIEGYKHDLLLEATAKVTEKLGQLSDQEKGLSISCTEIQSVIDYTQQCVEHSADDEIMCMHTKLQSRLEKEMTEQEESDKKCLEPVEEADMVVEVSLLEDLKQLCQAKAKIVLLPCSVKFDSPKVVEVNKPFEASFVVINKRKRWNVECCLKSLVNGSTVKCDVELVKDNEYKVLHTPTVRGRHELIVTLNGQEVPDAVFPLLVSINPTQLKKPARVIARLPGEPLDVAVNSKGDTIVAYSEGISVFDKTGKKLTSRMMSNCNIVGVTVDDTDDYIYVISSSNDEKIMKLTPDLKLLKVHKSKEFIFERSMMVVGDNVVVHNGTNLLLYTKELNYLKRATRLHSIQGLSCDEHGNLYVVDNNDDSSDEEDDDDDKSMDTTDCSLSSDDLNDSDHKSNGSSDESDESSESDDESNKSNNTSFQISVFSEDGKFVRSFDLKKNIEDATGTCVAGQHIYVTDSSPNHNVAVFTTNGEYVTSFGKEGKSKGNFDSPCGACVDKDGYVYICDSSNKRVQIF